MTARFRELVRWAYDGEVFGVAFLDRLIAAGAHPSRQQALEGLRDLEAQTLALVAPVVAREIGDVDDEAALVRAADYASGIAVSPWAEFLDDLENGADRAMPTFVELAELAPLADAPTFERLVRHETVMAEFARLDRRGRADEAQRVVREHIASGASS